MMGETSYYNPATVYARKQHRGGRLRPASSTPRATTCTTWTSASTRPTSTAAARTGRRTASYPPDAVSDALDRRGAGRTGGHAVSGQLHRRRRRPRRRRVRQGRQHVRQRLLQRHRAVRTRRPAASMRINEMRRVGYPSHLRESPLPVLRHGGQLRAAGHGQSSGRTRSRRDRRQRGTGRAGATLAADDPALADVSRRLCGTPSAPVWHPCTTPAGSRPSSADCHNGHEGSHHFLVDDFATAVDTGTLPARQRLGGRPLHPAGHRRARVRPPRRGAVARAGPRRRPRPAACAGKVRQRGKA